MTIHTSEPDHYQVLGVEPGASAAAIKKAYRALMMRLHPDKNPDPAANEQAKLVNRAFEVVGNPQNRATYDGTRGVGRPTSGHRQPRPNAATQAAAALAEDSTATPTFTNMTTGVTPALTLTIAVGPTAPSGATLSLDTFCVSGSQDGKTSTSGPGC